jgi:uncharacterized protein
VRGALYPLVLLGLALVQPAAAQDARAAEREKLAQVVIEKARMSATMEQMGVQMLAGLEPIMRQGLVQSGVVPENLEKALVIFKQKMNAELGGPAFRDQLLSAAAKEYAREFDESELRALIAFFDSPSGRKMLDRQPVLMQRSMALGQRLGEEGGRRAGAATMEELRKQGLLPAGKGK